MPPRVTDLMPEHLPALRELFLLTRRASFTWSDTSRFALEDFDEQVRDERIQVALDAGNAIGFVAWWPPDHFIHHLYVHPAHQGRGVGGALLRSALEQMGRPASLKCLTLNTRALAFYAARGWRIASAGGEGDEAGPYYLMILDAQDETAQQPQAP